MAGLMLRRKKKPQQLRSGPPAGVAMLSGSNKIAPAVPATDGPKSDIAMAPSPISTLQKRYIIGFEQAGFPDWTEMEFASPIPRFTACLVCGSIASEMLWSRCWHVFCPLCTALLTRDDGSLPCPFDGVQTETAALHRDKIAMEVLLAFRVFCPNRSLGCDHIGSMEKLRDHTRLCGFYSIQCQICGIWLKRFQLREHATQGCAVPEDAIVGRRIHGVVNGHLYPDIERMVATEEAAAAARGAGERPSKLSVIFNGNSKEYDVLSMITAMKEMCREYEDFKNAFNGVRETVGVHVEQMRADVGALEEKLHMEQRHWRDDLLSDVRFVRDVLGTRSFDWQISPYSKLKKPAIRKKLLLKSEGFYIGYQGYHVALSGSFLKNPADGKIYVNVFVHLLKGIFDSVLSWPYRKLTTVKLLNQVDNGVDKVVTFDPCEACEDEKDSFQRPKGPRNVGYGFRLAPLEELEHPDNGFLRNDSFVVQLIVGFP
ncbi:unnamed protein product [Ixodes hexagonus]